jgi:hypothetical protein
MSKSDKKFAEKVSTLESKLAECETMEDPIAKKVLTDLRTSMLKTEMAKRADKIGK